MFIDAERHLEPRLLILGRVRRIQPARHKIHFIELDHDSPAVFFRNGEPVQFPIGVYQTKSCRAPPFANSQMTSLKSVSGSPKEQVGINWCFQRSGLEGKQVPERTITVCCCLREARSWVSSAWSWTMKSAGSTRFAATTQAPQATAAKGRHARTRPQPRRFSKSG